MSSQNHVIYIPGIADDIYHVQSLLLLFWRIYGFHGHMHEMPWRGTDSYPEKHEKLLKHIDALHAEGFQISMVAASAGASAALNAYIERRDIIDKVVIVCGKINRPNDVSERLYRRNQAFRPALKQLQHTLTLISDSDKIKVLSLYSPADKTVSYIDSHVDGIFEIRLWPLSHATSILTAISFQFRHISHFIKAVA